MKYIVILGDGMADEKSLKIENKTPLEVANKPYMDYMANNGTIGLVKTVYDGLSPGSDVANLTVMGYNTLENYSGRSPLEAASIGVELDSKDITYRANLVTLSNEINYDDKIMVDYSASEISTDEADILIKEVQEKLGDLNYQFFTGTSYRHLLVRKDEKMAGNLVPPHDISDKVIGEYLPTDAKILDLMKKSYNILSTHEINKKRVADGKNPANSLWIWGEGTKPNLESFKSLYGIEGSVISAVDLIKGIGYLSGLKVVKVPNVTGTIHTNFDGKAKAGIECLKNGDEFLYMHIEAADESGHQGSVSDKIRSIELIDKKIIKPIFDYLKQEREDFIMLVLPDHPTPWEIKTHTSQPVPFIVYKSFKENNQANNIIYSEFYGKESGIYIEEGHKLLLNVIKGLI